MAKNRVFGAFRNGKPWPAVVLLAIVALAAWGLSGGSRVADRMIPQPTPTPVDERFERFKGDCTTDGVEFTDDSFDAEARVKVFGPPNTPESEAIVYFFDHEVLVHEKVAPCLDAVERDLKDQGTTYTVDEIGGYREERADRPYWFHQYGGAVDINPRRNPQCLGDLEEGREGAGNTALCGRERPYDLPDEWIKTFERYGFYWGGKYREGKDYMHFEWRGEKPS